MPVAEYMLHKEGHRRLVPEFISDRGHWYNPADHTYIGWIDDNPDHYVPDTIVYLTKEEFITRAEAIHQTNPFRGNDEEVIGGGEALTTEQLQTMASVWYDEFVAKNSAE